MAMANTKSIPKCAYDLAEAVRKHPPLYDKSSKDYKDTNVKARIWTTVAAESRLKSGKEAMLNFRNLRKRYTNAKKRFRAKNVSGTSAKQVEKAKKALDAFDFMKWLDSHIQKRKTKSNLDDDDDSELDEGDLAYVEDDEDLDLEDVEEEQDDGRRESEEDGDEEEEANSVNSSKEILENSHVDVPQTPETGGPVVPDGDPDDLLFRAEPPAKKKALPAKKKTAQKENAGKQGALPKSKKVKNWEAIRSVEKEELNILRTITNKLDQTDSNPKSETGIRDQHTIFGELVASKMRSLEEDTQIEAEMAINNVLSRHQMKDIQRKKSSGPLSAGIRTIQEQSPAIQSSIYCQPRLISPVYGYAERQNYNSSPFQSSSTATRVYSSARNASPAPPILDTSVCYPNNPAGESVSPIGAAANASLLVLSNNQN